MSVFLHNEACPRCRAKGQDTAGDNLAVYSDGHKYCYKCKYYLPGDALHKLSTEARPEVKPDSPPEPVEFSKETLEYLKQFGLTNEEIFQYLQGHPDGYAFVDSKFFLVRRLAKMPKVITRGEVVGNEPVFKCVADSSPIVLCEDIISAIKISRVADSCALLKTHIHDIMLSKLSKWYDTCYIWLDPDMYTHMANELLPRIQPYFVHTSIIMSKLDPKYYSTQQIKEYLNVTETPNSSG
jgi:hypothetical protein